METTALPDASVNKNLQGTGARARVQRFGGFLASMIMPNIGAFIAWGLITALFIEAGWAPNEQLASMVGPILSYLLPILIAYTGGKLVHGQRGAVVGAIAGMGVIIGSEIPMFLGAMIMGPLAAWVLKVFDKAIEGKIRAGFEMLVDNFSTGILGMILAIIGNYGIGPVVTALVNMLSTGVETLVNAHLLPLVSIFVEPGKVLFLNNAINHGIFSPLGVAQAQETGRSILFMIESNPGSGLGLLTAFMLFGPKNLRPATSGAIVIHFLGGIHEIYFPYVLMKPVTILATIAGSVSALFVGTLLNAGLVAPASPGSIIAYVAVTPRDGFIPMIAMVVTAAVVSFVVCSALLKFGRGADEGDTASASASAILTDGPISRLIVACDAGMGSSVMVASQMKKRLAPYGVQVVHTPVDQIPDDAQLVLTQTGLVDRAARQVPGASVIGFENYLADPAFDQVEAAIKASGAATAPAVAPAPARAADEAASLVPQAILRPEAIQLGLPSVTKEDAIRQAGQLLVDLGAADPAYIDGMLAREQEISTYMDNGVAIPHGVNASRVHIKQTALGFLQFPEGIDWDGEMVHVVIPIASNNDEHVTILANLAGVLVDDEKVARLRDTSSVDQVRQLLEVNSGLEK